MAGKKVRSGRKSFALTERARFVVERDKLLDVAAKIAKEGERDSDRLNAIRFLVEYGYGKVTQPVSGPSGQTFTLTFGDASRSD